MKNAENEIVKEAVNSVKLNEETNYIPYILGRLFLFLEASAGQVRNHKTIRDRYFNAACGTRRWSSVLMKLAQSHLRKLDTKPANHHQKQIAELLGAWIHRFHRT